MGELLAVKGLEVTYNGVAVALHGVSLSVPEHGIVAVLGPNGAGKTSTLRAISGFMPSENGRVTAGTITLAGGSIARLSPHKVARAGVGIVPERTKVFATLTVQENLDAAPMLRGAASRRRMLGFVFELFPVLAERRRQQAGLLSGGERQMLAVSSALLLEPSLLLADELSFGIAPVLLDKILDAIRTINKTEGVSVLLVEQNARAAFEVADYVYVMEAGRVVAEGTPADLLHVRNIQDHYFGLDEPAISLGEVRA